MQNKISRSAEQRLIKDIRVSPNKQIGILPPGPIQNLSLFIEEEKSPLLQPELILPRVKKGLVMEKDYKTVCREVWEKFSMIYGGGPAIIRCEQSIYSDPAIEEIEAYRTIFAI